VHRMKVIICGAGAIGVSIAFFLSKKGVFATVVERCGVACAASGKSGGFLALDWCDNSSVGPLARKSFALHAQLAQELDKDYGFRVLDTLSVKAHQQRGERKSKIVKDLPIWLDTETVSSSSTIGTTKTTAQVFPLAYTNALMNAAQACGTKLLIGVVEGVQITDSKVVGVQVDGKVIDADVVVIAMGPWSHKAAEWFPSIPVVSGHKAHSIVLHPNENVTAHALFLQYKSADGTVSDPEIYPRPDGDVYVCGMGDSKAELPDDPSAIEPTSGSCETLKSVASSLSTSLESAELRKSQACFLPISPDGTPLIGKIAGVEGAFIATGHSCWGILNAPATGAAMAELIVDGHSSVVDLAPFDPSRFVRKGEKLTKKQKL